MGGGSSSHLCTCRGGWRPGGQVARLGLSLSLSPTQVIASSLWATSLAVQGVRGRRQEPGRDQLEAMGQSRCCKSYNNWLVSCGPHRPRGNRGEGAGLVPSTHTGQGCGSCANEYLRSISWDSFPDTISFERPGTWARLCAQCTVGESEAQGS